MLTSHRPAGGPVVIPSLEKTTLPFVNRSTSLLDEQQTSVRMMSGSESDLSDVPDHPLPAAAPSRSSLSPITYGNGLHADESELSEDGNGLMGSDDGDFEVDFQPPEAKARRGISSSPEESPRPPKRKAANIEDDEDIMNNPELYGIRRSVRSAKSDATVSPRTKCFSRDVPGTLRQWYITSSS